MILRYNHSDIEPRRICSYREVLGNLTVNRVLDVATCQGHFIQVLMESLPVPGQMIGMDISRRFYLPDEHPFSEKNVHFVRMDFNAPGFYAHAFDMVVMGNALHYMDDVPHVLNQMMTLLKPGGYLLISEMMGEARTLAQQPHLAHFQWWVEISELLGCRDHNPLVSAYVLAGYLKGLHLADVEYFILPGDSDEDCDREERQQSIQRRSGKALKNLMDHAEYPRLKAESDRIQALQQMHGWQFQDHLVILAKIP